MADSVIVEHFGRADETGFDESKNAVVWTYVMSGFSGDGASASVVGYQQFAFWNGKVAGVNTRWLGDADKSLAIHASTLAYMGEDGRTIAQGGGADSAIFTADLRISRHGDNFWMADWLQDGKNSHATPLVGDVGYRGCRTILESEAKRVESKFGIAVFDSSASVNK